MPVVDEPTNFKGAWLDDYMTNQAANCNELSNITWPSLAAGLVPAVLKHGIIFWITEL